MSVAIDGSTKRTMSTSASNVAHHAVQSGGGKVLAGLGGLVAIALVSYFGVGYLRGSETSRESYVTYEVKRQDMDVLVVERGSLESGKNVDIICEVEAR